MSVRAGHLIHIDIPALLDRDPGQTFARIAAHYADRLGVELRLGILAQPDEVYHLARFAASYALDAYGWRDDLPTPSRNP